MGQRSWDALMAEPTPAPFVYSDSPVRSVQVPVAFYGIGVLVASVVLWLLLREQQPSTLKNAPPRRPRRGFWASLFNRKRPAGPVYAKHG